MEKSPPLLLYSLAEYRELLFEAFDLAGARDLVEVGSETGTFTGELATWARSRGGSVTCVEPVPTAELRAWAAEGALHLVEGRSPAALEGLPAADAYLLDGDHNYATVRGELEVIDRCCFAAGKHAVVVLHDVGWPCARRDLYYAPAALPPEAVHPHSFDRGVVPDDPALVDGGFRGEGAFAFAEREGGPRNGVRTAVDDFLSGRDDLAFLECPLVFGAGFLFPRAAAWGIAMDATLRPYAAQPLLGRVEENRIALYLRVLRDQDRRARDRAALEAERDQRMRDLAVLDAERERRVAAEARLAAIDASLAHRIARRAQRLKERIAPAGTLRRQACDAAITVMKRG